jgi:hypothetical protein
VRILQATEAENCGFSAEPVVAHKTISTEQMSEFVKEPLADIYQFAMICPSCGTTSIITTAVPVPPQDMACSMCLKKLMVAALYAPGKKP